MPFSCEDIKPKTKAMRQLLSDTEDLIKSLSNIFFIEYDNEDAPKDELILIQIYIASLNIMIPELRKNIDRIENGEYDTVDFTVNIIELMSNYINRTKDQFEELIIKYHLKKN